MESSGYFDAGGVATWMPDILDVRYGFKERLEAHRMKTAENAIDLDSLANYLEASVPGFRGPVTLQKFPDGQSNPTFKLQAGSGVYVLRRQPPGKLLKSAHAVDREYRVLQALGGTDVPVPDVYHLCENTDVIGTMFYLMEYCDGEVFWNAALPEVTASRTRTAIYEEMNRVLTAIHSVDVKKSGLLDYGYPGNYFQRQTGRWTKQYRASELSSISAMDKLIDWLSHNIPADDGKVALVHGDYRLDNVMFAKDQTRIIAVLDWELSTLGHPYADLAYQCMALRLPHNDDPATLSGLRGIDAGKLGIPDEATYVASYCRRMGISEIENWSFYLAFSFFRLAAIAQGVAKRAIQGNASHKQAAAVGAMVPVLAEMALEVIAAPV
jgi:aminoglycoside phosphotransferase (APT) family kinase protein